MVIPNFISNIVSEIESVLLKNYYFKDSIKQISLLKSIPNIVLKVVADKNYIVKIYTRDQSLSIQHEFLEFSKSMISSQRIIKNIRNEIYCDIKLNSHIYFLVLKSYEEGRQLDYNSLEQFYLLGESLNRLHNCATIFPINSKSINRKENVFINFENINNFCIENNICNIDWCNTYQLISLHFNNKDIFKDSEILIHGDLSLDNVLFSKNEIIFLDFDELCICNPIYDLACIAWSIDVLNLPYDCWQSFKLGYYSNIDDYVIDKNLFRLYIIYRELEVMNYYLLVVKCNGMLFLPEKYIERRLSFVIEKLNYKGEL